jgi:hypothetical protein
MLRRDLLAFVVFPIVAACGGGGSSTNDPPPENTALTREQCEAMLAPSTDFTSADLGAKPESRASYNVFAESTVALAATSAKIREDVQASCTAIARDLDASAAEQSAATANTDPNAQVKAWCKLAASRIRAVSTSGSFRGSVPDAPCGGEPDLKFTCVARCSPREPNCEADCDRLVVAKLQCTAPKVTVDLPAGASAEAQRAKTTLEANLGTIFVTLRSRGSDYVSKVSELPRATNRLAEQVDSRGAQCIVTLVQRATQCGLDTHDAFEAATEVAGTVSM